MPANITAGIDWITLSARLPKDRLQNGQLWALIAPFLEELDQIGIASRDASYRGYHGVDYDGVRYLENDDWAFSEIPGGLAERVYIAWLGRMSALKVTRLDLCVDVTGENVGNWFGKTAHSQAHHPRDGRKRSLSEVGRAEEGYTCYIGSPTSDYRIRVYRKDIQSPIEFANWPWPVWRYEIRIKKPYSDRIARNLAEMDESERRAAIASYVYDELWTRGVTPPWARDDAGTIGVPSGRDATPIDRTLYWLERSVSPTVLKLIEAGYLSDVIRALGLAATSEVAKLVIRELTD